MFEERKSFIDGCLILAEIHLPGQMWFMPN